MPTRSVVSGGLEKGAGARISKYVGTLDVSSKARVNVTGQAGSMATTTAADARKGTSEQREMQGREIFARSRCVRPTN